MFIVRVALSYSVNTVANIVVSSVELSLIACLLMPTITRFSQRCERVSIIDGGCITRDAVSQAK